MSTRIYEGLMTHDYGDAHLANIMRAVWKDTPWMVNAFTGSSGGKRWEEIREWCVERFGPEAWPLHGRPGRWYSGGTILYGWRWMGFDTEEAMREFEAAWPTPPGAQS